MGNYVLEFLLFMNRCGSKREQGLFWISTHIFGPNYGFSSKVFPFFFRLIIYAFSAIVSEKNPDTIRDVSLTFYILVALAFFCRITSEYITSLMVFL